MHLLHIVVIFHVDIDIAALEVVHWVLFLHSLSQVLFFNISHWLIDNRGIVRHVFIGLNIVIVLDVYHATTFDGLLSASRGISRQYHI